MCNPLIVVHEKFEFLNELNSCIFMQDITMEQQQHMWRHSGAHIRVPFTTTKQVCSCHQGLAVYVTFRAIE